MVAIGTGQGAETTYSYRCPSPLPRIDSHEHRFDNRSSPAYIHPASQFFPNLWFAQPRHLWRGGKRVQDPRCRATVNEDTAAGHWRFREGRRCWMDAPASLLVSQETGANRQLNPFRV